MNKTITIAAFCALSLPHMAQAASVDLTGWVAEDFSTSNQSNWVVSAGTDSVTQTVNTDPAVFFKPGDNAQGTELTGSITVGSTSDDDFVGFVLGYQSGELTSTNADFWVIDWKRNNQSFYGGLALDGLALSHVTGDTAAAGLGDLWHHSGTVEEVARGATLGSTGWVIGETYDFALTFTASLIEVYVNDVLEISYSGSFSDGAFGFYNFSQNNVTYAGVEAAPAVPLPASLPLLLAGLGGIGAIRRRKNKA